MAERESQYGRATVDELADEDLSPLDEPWESLEEYRVPLEKLEGISLQRWEDLTRQSRWSFRISTGMSLGLFLVGTAIVFWGLVLLTRSKEPSQQIGGGMLSALAALATTYSSRFWKDPVDHIQKFSAQQACVQAVFIGYMNRVAQLRLVFEHRYKKGKIKLGDLEMYQRMLGEAVAQASQQLVDCSPPPPTSAKTTHDAEESAALLHDHLPTP